MAILKSTILFDAYVFSVLYIVSDCVFLFTVRILTVTIFLTVERLISLILVNPVRQRCDIWISQLPYNQCSIVVKFKIEFYGI